MSFYPYSFEGEIVHHHVGSYRYTVIFLDADLITELPLKQHPRLRVTGEVGEVPFEGAWQPVNGRWYLMLSKSLLKQSELALGDRAEVRFAVADQSAVDVPAELMTTLNAEAERRSIWDRLTPGKQRMFAIHVSSAKTKATRDKRIAQVAGLFDQAALDGNEPSLRKDMKPKRLD